MPPTTVLVVGATGSIGRLVVEEALRQGYRTRALVRDPAKAGQLPGEAQLVVGDVTRPDTLPAAVDGVDAVVFTLGSDGAGKVGAETVDYGGVRNVLTALGPRPARFALMTSIGVTNFELVAEPGPAPTPENLDALLASLDEDPPGSLDGAHDTANMPPDDEPQRVRADLTPYPTD